MILAERYLRETGSGFAAYMALQRALLDRWIVRGGSEETWCLRLAPLFRHRYGALLTRSPGDERR